LGVDVDIARGDERVDPRSLASLQSLACGLDVSGKRTSQSTDNGPVYLLNDTRHGLELSGRRDRKSGLDYIHIETGQLLREPDLLGNGHGSSRRLLAVSQRGVEYDDSILHDIQLNNTEGSSGRRLLPVEGGFCDLRGHFGRRHLRTPLVENVGGSVSLFEGGIHARTERGGRLVLAQVLQHHRAGEGGRARIGESLPGDARRTAVYGHEQAPSPADAGGWKPSERARKRRRQIRQDVTEEIPRDDDIEIGGPAD